MGQYGPVPMYDNNVALDKIIAAYAGVILNKKRK